MKLIVLLSSGLSRWKFTSPPTTITPEKLTAVSRRQARFEKIDLQECQANDTEQ